MIVIFLVLVATFGAESVGPISCGGPKLWLFKGSGAGIWDIA